MSPRTQMFRLWSTGIPSREGEYVAIVTFAASAVVPSPSWALPCSIEKV